MIRSTITIGADRWPHHGRRRGPAGATVAAIETTTGSGAAYQTDADGNYLISNLPDGSYRVFAFSNDGFGPAYYNGRSDLGSADVVQITGGAREPE